MNDAMNGISTDLRPTGTFRLEPRRPTDHAVTLSVQPFGSTEAPKPIWSHRFDTVAERDLVLGAANDGILNLVFLGRLAMTFGGDALDEIADKLVAASRAEQAKKLKEEAQRERDHFVVNLYAREGKYGGHLLELQRRSSDKAEWSVAYDRAIERDRLCDWMRWQKERFLGFLDHAAEHGGESLARMLIDEMFATERRVKKEGRGAGGMRPLRMWRGD